jgi:hypothetical protein
MSKKKETQYYDCELCDKTVTHLFAICCCEKCETKLRKYFAHYKKERERVEKRPDCTHETANVSR